MRSKLSGRLRAGWFMAASAAALALVLVPAAQAATNVVPNPGFETAGCGTTLIICNWAATSGGAITQDSTNPHSGAFSMHITSSSGNNAAAVTGNGFCTALAAGVHQSSFFYRTTDIDLFAVALHATFWTNASCTSFASDVVAAFQAPTKDGQWHQATGTFTVPAGNFVTFALVGACGTCFAPDTVNFDDVDVESELLAVAVSSFQAVRSDRGILVRWRTGTEADTLGFHVYREHAGKWARVDRRLLPAKSAISGARYSFLDRRAPRGKLRYRLQAIGTDGSRTWFGTVSVR